LKLCYNSHIGLNYKFQEPIGEYLIDFLLPNNLIIEVDGEYWHDFPEGRDKDRIRDDILNSMGYKVLRFWANDVLKMKSLQLP
jgi:very-short-patch-repair endonuclease